MRLSLRFLVPLLLALGAFAYGAVPLADALMQRWFVRDLDMRSTLIATTVQEPIANLIATGSKVRIIAYFQRMLQDERLYAVALCLEPGGEPIATVNFPPGVRLRDARRLEGRRRPRAGVAARPAAPCGARGGRRGGGRRAPRDGARHELRHAPQRGDAAAVVLFLRGTRPRASRSSPL